MLPALAVPPDLIIDTNGAGDIFHGAYVYSALARPGRPWREHFIFARAASAYAIQHLGNEAEPAEPRRRAEDAGAFWGTQEGGVSHLSLRGRAVECECSCVPSPLAGRVRVGVSA